MDMILFETSGRKPGILKRTGKERGRTEGGEVRAGGLCRLRLRYFPSHPRYFYGTFSLLLSLKRNFFLIILCFSTLGLCRNTSTRMLCSSVRKPRPILSRTGSRTGPAGTSLRFGRPHWNCRCAQQNPAKSAWAQPHADCGVFLTLV